MIFDTTSTMSEFISLLLITLMLIILDFVWFSFSLESIYKPTFEMVQGSPLEMRVAGGIIAWFLIAVGIRYLIKPADYTSAATSGALLGLVVYGVYNATNYATFKNYPASTAFADTAWGMFVCAVGAVVSSAV